MDILVRHGDIHHSPSTSTQNIDFQIISIKIEAASCFVRTTHQTSYFEPHNNLQPYEVATITATSQTRELRLRHITQFIHEPLSDREGIQKGLTQ